MAGLWPGSGPNRPKRFTKTSSGWTYVRTKTQPAKARIQATTSQVQTAKARIGTLTNKTQPAKARIQVTTTKTQPAKARITATTTRTQGSVARIEAVVLRTQPAKARITATTIQTQLAKGRVTAIIQQVQTARARIGPNNLRVRAPAAPALAVKYGAFSLNEAAGVIISSEPNSFDNSIFGQWSCIFRVRMRPEAATGNGDAADDALFQTWLVAVETALRIPRQELVVTLGAQVIRDWTFAKSTQTAFLIYPELDLIRTARRDFTYKFTVRCQFPGNIPSNAFRRESNTAVGDSLRHRRLCEMVATWTSQPGKDAYETYLANGNNFFDAYLPPNVTDQYGDTGTWIRADENPVSFNDEKSLCTAKRVYWECFKGRRESLSREIETIGDRNTFRASSVWVATATANALQNYIDGGDGWYGKVLPAPSVGGASWVLVDEEPEWNDPNGLLTVTRVYHEVVDGLRDLHVDISTRPNQLRHFTIRGSYYSTSQTAKINYQNNIQKQVDKILSEYTVTRYEAKSTPKFEQYDTTRKRYFFVWHIHELAYPQGAGTGADDPNFTLSSLEIDADYPFDKQSIPVGVPITRLQHVVARFTAVVDYTKNQDPAKLWSTSTRAYVLNAVASKLGSTIAVEVIDEQVGVGLDKNTLHGTLNLLVTGGSVLALRLAQELVQVPGRDFAARADGTQFSDFPYFDVAEKILVRSYIMEYVVGTTPPDPFASNDVSGLGIIQTGMTAQQSIDAQNATGDLSGAPGWFIDRRSAKPFSVKETPCTQGQAFQTIMREVTETWKYIETLEPQ